MTEVAYGQFMDIYEDAVCPLAKSNEEEPILHTGKSWGVLNYDLIKKFFKAMETINNAQLENSASVTSFASSNNSLSSMPSSPKLQNQLTPQNIFTAMQAATLNNYESTNSLNNFDEANEEEKKEMIPVMIKKMMVVFDEFMHNHTYLEESSSSRSQKETSSEFPKFC